MRPDGVPVRLGPRGRLAWPLAAAVIGGLSLAAWAAIGWLVLQLIRG
jgi:hypothetical protein